MVRLQSIKFSEVDINDQFFNSLKDGYAEFSKWFNKKKDENALILFDDFGGIQGFLYLKQEDESLEDIIPIQPLKRRLKIGTFKVDSHGTRVGELFIKKALDSAILYRVEEVYVTIYPKHDTLIKMFEKYGFVKLAKKGSEVVLIKNMSVANIKHQSVLESYPYVIDTNRYFCLSIYPKYHSKLFPDSILTNENPDEIIKDISFTNSIHKIYSTNMGGTDRLCEGDIILIYRTKDKIGAARHRSVITSLCVVEEIKNINSFTNMSEFLKYTSSYSIFSKEELVSFYEKKQYPVILRFTYNIAFAVRPTNGDLIDKLNIKPDYWGFFQLSSEQFLGILKLGKVNENIIISKT